MIATVLFLTKKLVEFIKKHFSELHNYDKSTIDLIEESLNIDHSITDSMLVFSNCETLNINLYGVLGDNNNNKFSYYDRYGDSDNVNEFHKCFWQTKKAPWPGRNGHLECGLSSHTRMESNTGASKLALPGATISSKKTPVSPRGTLTSPEPDCNSNNLTMTNDITLYCNNKKVQDCHDFFQDNSEYQWFLDYGYKDNSQHHQSVFSILSSHDMLHYDDLARDLDANLAEVDMEDFHREDIHSILSTLPNMCSNELQGVEEREMYASMSESMMVKFNFDNLSPHSSSQEEHSNSTSMCKSELLFSPVRESYLPNGNLSVDSLDLSENDINLLITCQANKNNYTIAFEGSTIMGSDDSEFPNSGVIGSAGIEEAAAKFLSEEMKHCHRGNHGFSASPNNSMVRSDSVYTTWSKIKQCSKEQLQLRHQSTGRSNHVSGIHYIDLNKPANTMKSLSLPNLFRQRKRPRSGMSLSSRFSCDFSSGIDSDQPCLKLYDIQKSNNSDSCGDHSTTSVGDDLHEKPPNLNLVKLFIKQKSASHEGMCNYVTERPIYISYSEGYSKDTAHKDSVDSPLKKDCEFYSNFNKNSELKPAKNGQTSQYKKGMIECSVSGFEDSLMSKNARKNDTLNEKENSDSESVEQITENLKQITESCLEHLNSNAIGDASHKNCQRMNVKSACTFNVNNNNSVLDNQKSKYLSDESTQENGSNTESTEHTACNCRRPKTIGTKINSMEKSIQTSKLLEDVNYHDKKEVKVPAYILYPNYALPNLEFLKEKHYVQNIDFTKIFLRPQAFKHVPTQTAKKRPKFTGKRPLSVNDIETLKKKGFKHVRDWDSLTFLLPKEYKEFLQEIPEIMTQIKDMRHMKDDFRPLFCLNTDRRKMKKYPVNCDSNFFTADCRSSNFSSTATQPSSGYRGSSTMLNSNNSNATPSPKNPSFGFRYDSNDSVFNSRKNTPLRSGSFMNSVDNDEPPPRPPLPRSILRNNSLDTTKYTCKTQKENANKRYSMIEFGEKNAESKSNKSSRRKSAQDPYCLKSPQKNYMEMRHADGDDERFKNDYHDRNDKCDEDEACLSFKTSSLDSDMRRLEELLEISAVFGESFESFNEQDMMKLRSQVSKFLTMQKNLQHVSECLQTVHEGKNLNSNKVDEDVLRKEKRLAEVKCSQTPNNTPEHKQKPNLALGEGYESDVDASPCLKCDNEDCQGSYDWQDYDTDEMYFKEEALKSLKKTVSFAEKISLMKDRDLKTKDLTPPNSPMPPSLQSSQKAYQTKIFKLVDVPICEESFEGSPGGSPKKDSISSSCLLHKKGLVLDVKNAVEKILHRSRSKNDRLQEELSNLCLHHLCPSLYAILSDGLKEETDTAFGPIRNSVWSVIEASSQQGPLTETLSHLVQRLNIDDILAEGLVKFNAFIFGLLNVNSLDAWFSYLRTRDSLLHKYYGNKGLLVLSNSAGAPIRVLMDHLIKILEPLSEIRFGLDLMYQAKLLHCSLQNLNSLIEVSSNDFLSPTKQLMLLKLVQSIQNSVNHPSEIRKGRSTVEEIEKITNDHSVPQLLEKSKRHHGSNKPRPRSGCDIINSDNSSDVASSIKKRWSGVQLNSKLLQAFERLREETESEYTDSLDNARGFKKSQSPTLEIISKRLEDSDNTFDDVSHTWNDSDSSEVKTKEQRKNVLTNLNKKNINRLSELKTDSEISDKLVNVTQSGGQAFKRLQQKWEKLSGKSNSTYSSGTSTPTTGLSPGHAFKDTTPKHLATEKHIGSNMSATSPTARVSRIPRPVSSPSQATPTNEKQNVAVKTINSPTLSSAGTLHQKGIIKPISLTKTDAKPKSAGTRMSRFDEVSDQNLEGARIRVVRPSSLPYRGPNNIPVKKNVPARASSTSLHRRPDKNSSPRFVRTLNHRLPSDSGHLSFNEGEKLKVILEVDDTWFLCCRGTQKGLVPKSAVITVPDHVKY